ncbi:hypothetical protein HZS_4999 [Henneguya salminicola]|nr:hypothetical protein HZS_4999 [Henneguya salminicola]
MAFIVDPEFIPNKINFVKEEERVLEYWKNINAFETSVKLSRGRPEFSFYDGPPFATGLPHYGHILAGTIKDIVTRYAYQTGHNVTRRFGWDCHGLPVEHEIDKIYNIKGPDDVLKMGIKQYNDACRAIVSRYAHEWESVVNRFGRWIDFKNDYKTMYPWFMESVWWAFKQIYDKDLVYQGFKVMPFSTACHTPLSNFETGQNYKDIVDPSVVIKFPKSDEPGTFFLAWTTTPWTLPSNLALIVHPDKVYVKIKTTESLFILMEARLTIIFSDKNKYTIIERFPGNSLIGCKYLPPFNYFKNYETTGAFKIYADPYVTEDSGTGIVHSAPAFGEDDLRVCCANNIISELNKLPCPVDVCGNFIEPVVDFIGMYVKDADSKIIKYLKDKKLVFLHSQHKHSYPFCWRSDTPILYRAVPSWFIKVESIIPQLLENNKQCYWVPEHVRDKRFHNWLANARDWNISRNRYWGTPIPLWISEDGIEVICIGSIEELFTLSGVRVTDLHRENIDHITIPSRMGKGILKRTTEVFDCWFESGSMPYSQVHYPFENTELFEKSFPADFIAEGIDQTRGWFYTLLVLSTAIFNKPPFKNLVVNGLILASDGQKMSKRKKNYPDPIDIVNKYGADTVRAYLINSPVVCGENLCFKESGLSDLTKDFFFPWFNSFRFFLQNKSVYEKKSTHDFIFDEKCLNEIDSMIDKWILSYTQSFVSNYRNEMNAYRLYNLVPNLQSYIDTITKWYIRLNRLVLRGDFGFDSQFKSLNILFHCLFQFSNIAASICPFICEYYFQNLKIYIPNATDDSYRSVHFHMIPQVDLDYVSPKLELMFARFRSVVDLGRKIREKNNIAMKHPLARLVVIHPESEYLEDIKQLNNLLLEEINVKEVVYSNDHSSYGLSLFIQPNPSLLGKKLRGDLKSVMNKINSFSQETLLDCLKRGHVEVEKHSISLEEIRILFKVIDSQKNEAYDVDAIGGLAVLLHVHPDVKLEEEGLTRDFVNKIQRLRKVAAVKPTDTISIYYSFAQSLSDKNVLKISNALQSNISIIQTIVKQPVILIQDSKPIFQGKLLSEDSFVLGGANITLSLYS